ncbi:BT4734/BF3469 family protein [Polaribacter sp. 11A2H]|uniref:BT4734/BF3469 family protein n=1 Tax=Polaribacter sp. 11A2H TaxID=2687290 RepID=UPI00140E10A7|nr:BT4734/BF3469 family protein [Polaribacter sp. 11A2H]
MNNNYYYFSTHAIHPQIYTRLTAHAEYQKLEEETQILLDKFVKDFAKRDKQFSILEYCSKFIAKHKDELCELYKLKVTSPKEYLYNFLGYANQWNASTRSFGKSSKDRAEEITEKELIEEMTSPKASIKKLLDASGGDLSAVKPFLPAIMISLKTNTRAPERMQFKHTGRFCFDIDGLKDKQHAIECLNRIWKGTKNIKPYMAFISPRGKGVKVFFKVDSTNLDFIKDFSSEDKSTVTIHHKVWYEGARKELVSKFPELKDKIDLATTDPQRLTYIPFIANKANDFKYDASRESSYSEIVTNERKLVHEALQQKISENQADVDKFMKENKTSSPEEAYLLIQKQNVYDFDLELETEKFVKVIDFIEEQTSKDSRLENWVSEEFDTYLSLQKLSWVLYGVFGDLAIEQIKRLIPANSNKLDETHNDYRWAKKSKDDYSEELLKSLPPSPFYASVRKIPIVNDFISENFGASSKNYSDFKILNDYYETYTRNKDLDDGTEDPSEFLDDITRYLDMKKMRLPLIKKFDSIAPEVILGPKDYLDKDVMHDIFQNKYTDKKIFFLRSQCGKLCAVSRWES